MHFTTPGAASPCVYIQHILYISELWFCHCYGSNTLHTAFSLIDLLPLSSLRFHWSSGRSVLSMVWSYSSASVSSSVSLNSLKKGRSKASEALTLCSGSRSSIFSKTHTAVGGAKTRQSQYDRV